MHRVGGCRAESDTVSRARLVKGEQAAQAHIIWGHAIAPKGRTGNLGVGISYQNPHFYPHLCMLSNSKQKQHNFIKLGLASFPSY